MRCALALLVGLSLPLMPGHAEPFSIGGGLDAAMVADVTARAIGFMAPRTLDPIPQARLGLWGLRGLATLDARLTPELRDGQLRLSLFGNPSRLLLARPLPPDVDEAAWGDMLAALIRAGWDASQPLRRVGTDGVLEVFFDEICNHLDAYSRYASPADLRPARDLRADLGLDVEQRRAGFVVASVAKGRPAALAGLRAGDVVLSVDGQDLDDLPQGEIPGLLAGPEASVAILRVRSRGGRPREVQMVRSIQPVQTVTSRWVGRILLLRISTFAPQTGAELASALDAVPPGLTAAARRSLGVVIDLRGNRGGLLREAVSAAESLLPEGLVAVTIGRDPAANHEFVAAGQDLAHGLPVIVLVDGGSASAAEILAAALADQHRAVVIGSSTVGKGLVQAVQSLPNGGELVLTWSRVLAPFGWPIQGLGVMPQVCTSMGSDAAAAQLEALDKGEQPMADMLSRHRDARPPVSSAEMLALRAVCPAAEGREDDLTTARFLVDHPSAYAAALIGPPPAP